MLHQLLYEPAYQQESQRAREWKTMNMRIVYVSLYSNIVYVLWTTNTIKYTIYTEAQTHITVQIQPANIYIRFQHLIYNEWWSNCMTFLIQSIANIFPLRLFWWMIMMMSGERHNHNIHMPCHTHPIIIHFFFFFLFKSHNNVMYHNSLTLLFIQFFYVFIRQKIQQNHTLLEKRLIEKEKKPLCFHLASSTREIFDFVIWCITFFSGLNHTFDSWHLFAEPINLYKSIN